MLNQISWNVHFEPHREKEIGPNSREIRKTGFRRGTK